MSDALEYAKHFEYRDGGLYWKHDASNISAGTQAGCADKDGYILVRLNKKRLFAHRIIFAMHHGYEPKYIDHINCDKSDNRIENLREASLYTNAWNRGANTNNKTGTKNVCWSATKNKWLVQLMANGKKVVYKSFDDFELAELVAIEARDKYHGAFAFNGV